MFKCVAAVFGMFAIAAALLAPGRADAGASASAPSKYAQTKQVVAAHQVRHVRRTDFGISEYSSSSVRTTAPRR
jgi:hypothetical protein